MIPSKTKKSRPPTTPPQKNKKKKMPTPLTNLTMRPAARNVVPKRTGTFIIVHLSAVPLSLPVPELDAHVVRGR